MLPLIAQAGLLTGKVTSDGKPVAGVFVSDGVTIAMTGADGRYGFESDKRQGFVFVITPSGYATPLKDGLRPDFYATLEKPAGLDESHDFVLIPQKQDHYTAIFATDIHIKNSETLGDKRLFETYALPTVKRLYAENSADGPVILFNLGDLAHDKVWYEFGWNIEKSRDYLRDLGYPGPLFSIMGNHDNDGATVATPYAPDENFNAEHLFRKAFGPTYYSFNMGGDHWIMMDNIIYKNTPVKKSKDHGIAGKRNFNVGLTDDEMDWLEKDLATVPEGVNIRLCAHASFLWPLEPGTQFTDPAQQQKIYDMVTKGGRIFYAYTGHTHRFQFAASEKYPLLRDVMVPAVSGNVWATGENQMVGIDGSDAGILVAHFGAEGTTFDYHTHQYGEKWMRLYDMNAAKHWFKTDERAAERVGKYPEWTDYSKFTGKNMIYANIWMYRPGYTVEMYEGSRKLKVEMIEASDPFILAGTSASESLFKETKHAVCRHLFAAQAKGSRSTITVNILDEDGKCIHTEKMIRPKPFGPGVN